jgi:pimeloyl-ACP methyl ester carboxylesterase
VGPAGHRADEGVYRSRADLRGIGRSSRPAGGYDKKTQAEDIRAVVTGLGFDRTAVVSHDIGIMVAYAYAARYPNAVERLVVMDAPLPGIGPWDEIVRNPLLWHFNVRGPDAERLVAPPCPGPAIG